MLVRTLRGYARHPNIGGLLVLGLGCEMVPVDVAARRAATCPPTRSCDDPDHPGRPAASAPRCGPASSAIKAMLPVARRAAPRAPAPVAELVLGLNCGGSDGYSGITANPALGPRVRPAGRRAAAPRSSPRPPRCSAPSTCSPAARSSPEVGQQAAGPARLVEGLHRGRRRHHGQQPLAGQQGRRADDDPREVARRRRQGRAGRPGRGLRVRRAGHRPRVRVHGHPRLRPGLGHRPRRRRRDRRRASPPAAGRSSAASRRRPSRSRRTPPCTSA